MQVKVYGSGDYQDEGGRFHYEERKVEAWIGPAQKHCSGCRNNFYNGRANMGGSHCWSLKKSYAKRKTRPSCYH